MGCGAIKVAKDCQVVPENQLKDVACTSATASSSVAKVDETQLESSNQGEPSESSSPGNKASKAERSDKQRKRVQKSNGRSTEESEAHDVEEPQTQISPENRKFLNKALQKHFLFSALEDDERQSLIDCMKSQNFETGSTVFSQGDRGDSFYVIQSGTFIVSIDSRALKQLKAKHTFGELALLYDVSRTATIACGQSGVVWRLDERAFRKCMDQLNNKHFSKVRGFFDSDATFAALKENEKDRLAGLCSVQTFQRGEVILREGEVGDWMFIIIKGCVSTVDQYGNTVVKQPGTILGISGLMYTKRQIFGAKAIEHVTCIAVGKSAIERLMGPVEKVLQRSAIKSLVLDNVGDKNGDLDFFKHLTEEQQNILIDNIEDATYAEGEVITTKGARAQLLIVIEGEIGVFSNDVVGEGQTFSSQQREYAKEVLTSGFTYGAKPLVDSSEMIDTTVALSVVKLHRVGSDALVAAFGDPIHEVIRLNEIKKVLSGVFLFKNLTDEQIDRTIRAFRKKKFSADEVIVKQGDDARHFFLIQSGVIGVMKDGVKLRTLGRWDYFGERGLLLKEKRSATCQAEGSVTCLVLDDDIFRDIVGLFQKDLEHRMRLQDLDITMHDLRLTAIVGRGTFGIVKLVKFRDDESKVYALKCVNKKQVVRQHQQKGLVVEHEINAQCYHPCIVQFIKTFQDAHDVYFLTEFLGGGDLFYAIREIGDLTKPQVQFYSGSIALALEYLHGRGIMYRDLKPENVLLDFHGNAKLVDFGCCKKSPRSSTLVGTPEYLAPEVILGKGYTCSIDWWALGVMIHEFIVGPLPFGRDTEDQLELFREILEAPLTFPQHLEDETAVSIISGLLDRSPELRTGSSSRGAKEIKEHRYFSGFDWTALAGRYLKPPWTPDTEKLKANWEFFKDTPLLAEGENDSFDKEKASVVPGMEWIANF